MSEEYEEIVMGLIVGSGSAKSFAMEAIRSAKSGDIETAREHLEEANNELAEAHKIQTGLIQEEAKGNHTPVNLFMVHAQDHVMTAMLAKDLAAEIVDLHEKLLQK